MRKYNPDAGILTMVHAASLPGEVEEEIDDDEEDWGDEEY